MSLLIYPVSVVMTFWHRILTGVLGVSDATAWAVSIVLLVLTVRLFLLPFAYRQFKSTRFLVNLRPRVAALEAEFADRHDPGAAREKLRRQRELQREGGYRMRDGCVPALIQVPFFLGLYQLLLRISRPGDLEATEHHGVGVLDGQDVGHFLDASVAGVPLPAYSVMSDEQFAFLGTTASDVFHLALPLCIAASVFTTANFGYSLYRNWLTLDHNSALAISLFRGMWLLLPVLTLFPLIFGLGGPAPVAIMCYWVMNNLWTLAQSLGLHLTLDRIVPYTPEFMEHRDRMRDARRARRAEVREARRGLARRERERSRAVRAASREERRAVAARVAEESRLDQIATDRVVHRERYARAEVKERRRAEAAAARAAAAAGRKDAGEGAGSGSGADDDAGAGDRDATTDNGAGDAGQHAGDRDRTCDDAAPCDCAEAERIRTEFPEDTLDAPYGRHALPVRRSARCGGDVDTHPAPTDSTDAAAPDADSTPGTGRDDTAETDPTA